MKKKKKVLLNLVSNFDTGLKNNISKRDVEIVSPSDYNDDLELSYILIRDPEEEFEKIESQYNILERNISVISLEKINRQIDFLKYGGRAYIDENILKWSVPALLWRRFLVKDQPSLHLENNFNDLIKEVFKIKITGHLGMGYYSDFISSYAFKNDFNIVAIRNYFINIIYYLTYLHKSEISQYPFDVSYGKNDDCFVLQVHASVKNFFLEYIWESLSGVGHLHPFKSFIRTCGELAPLFDICYLEKNLKVIFTAVWPNQKLIQKKDFFNSFIVDQVKSVEQHKNTFLSPLKRRNSIPKVELREVEEHMATELEEKELPGDHIDLVETPQKLENIEELKVTAVPVDEANERPQGLTEGYSTHVAGSDEAVNRRDQLRPRDKQLQNLNDLKGIVDFIKEKRKDSEFLLPDEIEKFLLTYPKKKSIKNLGEEEREFILECLWNPDFYKSLLEESHEDQKVKKKDDSLGPYLEEVVEEKARLAKELERYKRLLIFNENESSENLKKEMRKNKRLVQEKKILATKLKNAESANGNNDLRYKTMAKNLNRQLRWKQKILKTVAKKFAHYLKMSKKRMTSLRNETMNLKTQVSMLERQLGRELKKGERKIS